MVDKSYVLTDAEIDDLMDDWFERDGETFIRATDKHRLGWEGTISSEGSYSDFFTGGKYSKKDIIKKAYVLAKDMMAVVDPPMRVNIKISKGSDSFTDGRTVVVGTQMFDDEELSVGERLDTFLGVTIHEGCHLRYTEFDKVNKLDHLHHYSYTEISIIQQIVNILEDERIEQLLGEDKPGLTRFLEKSKYFFFDQYYLDFVVPHEKDMTDFERLINIFLRIIRYPKYLREDDIVFFGYHLASVKDLVVPYPTSTEQVVDTAVGIYEIFKEFYKEKLSREEAEKPEDLRDSEYSDDESYEDADTPSEDSPEIPKEMTDGELEEAARSKLTDESRRILPVLAKISPTTTASESKLGDSEVSKVLRGVDGAIFAEGLEGTLEVGSATDSFFTRKRDEKSIYMESYGRIQKFIPSISKILRGNCREYKYIHRGMRHGLLDPNKLAEAYQGVPNVYIREGEVKTDKVAIVVLIDESGSMSGDRIQAARDTAILINEAVGSISNVELYIYGHTGDIRYSGATELNIYRERTYKPKYSLGSVAAHSQNRDGVAIYEIAQRVRKQTKLPVLYFILSDGSPCADGYGGVSAVEHTRLNVRKVEKMGFSVVQVCINHSYDPKTMFSHYVILDDMSRLAFDLGRVIKQATLQNSKNYII